jgi:alcohol dehydrogenase
MEIIGAVLEEVGRPAPYARSRPITISELELDPPQQGEILVRILAAGICHSDLSVLNGDRPRPTPMLLGHESTGIVEALGPGVDDIDIGQHVTLAFLPRCGECASCHTDGKLPCEPGTAANTAGTLLGGGIRLHRNGGPVLHHLGVSGFATYAVVNRKSAVPVPASVPPTVAAVLGCAVLTGGGAVRNTGKPKPGDDIIVVGLGGVGLSAVLTAAGLNLGSVIGVDANLDKTDVAIDMGADAVYSPEQAIRKGIKAPVVVEAAGHPAAFEAAVALTAPGGITVTAGLPNPAARASISPAQITGEARTIVGSYLGSAVPARDIPVYAQMWLDGKLPVEKLISAEIKLDEINAAMDALAEGRAVRQVITFD